MYRGSRIAVVVPAYNEADKIARTVRSIPKFVDHVIVIDDGSHDNTAKNARTGRRGLLIVKHEKNQGVGAAIATGYAKALELGADVTAVMAGDSQMDPLDLPPLLEAVQTGRADYAKGNRFAWQSGTSDMPKIRWFGNVVLSHLTQIATGLSHVFDSQCGYTAANRTALLAIARAPMFPRYGYPNHVLAQMARTQMRVVDVPVRPVYGPKWRSGIRVHRVVWPLLRLLTAALLARISRGFRASAKPTEEETTLSGSQSPIT